MKSIYRMAWSASGAAIAVGLALWLVRPPASPFLLASIGGSAIFLFGLTSVHAAQPRALFGGHLGSAAIGILCAQMFGDALWVYVLACVLTLVFMLATGTVHPPAGATPLIMVQAHAGWEALWQPVAVSIVVLAGIAVIWTRLTPGMVKYPVKWLDRSPPSIWRYNWED